MGYGTPEKSTEYNSFVNRQFNTPKRKKTPEELYDEQIKEIKRQTKLKKQERTIRTYPQKERYEELKFQKKIGKQEREQKSFEQEEYIRNVKAEKKFLQQSRGMKDLRKGLKEERFRTRHPVAYRGRQVGERGFEEIKKASTSTQRGIQRQGTRILGSIAGRFTDRGQKLAMPPSAGLGERAVIEASANYVPHLDRQYFSEGSEQRDLLGQGNRDMASLIETPETIIKKREQRYY